MLKNYNKFLILFFVFSFNSVGANEYFQWTGNLYKNIREYNKIHSEFSKQVCIPGTDFKFLKLLRAYRGQGNYLPLLGNDIDRDAIKNNLKWFKKKVQFITNIEKQLKSAKKLPAYNLITKDVKETIHNLLELKKDYNIEVDSKKQIEIEKKSQDLLLILNKQFNTLLGHFFFLKSFNFPVDHLKNRYEFENVKHEDKIKAKKSANELFFYRKIVEDGALDPDHTRPDIYTRSTLDTLALNIIKEKNFISENIRHDLDWVLKVAEKIFDRGYKVQLSRIAEWKTRTIETEKFYKEIIQSKNKNKAKQLVKEKNDATINLKQFVYEKQAETYEFWQKKDRLWKALFALETILYNEVGTVDGEDALERRDVAHIVMNRVLDPFYSSLEGDQPLMKYLKLKKETWEKEKWLNTLFKVGEFSFTYHYIPSVAKIFCPDMSKRGKQIRDKNLKISLKAMKDPRDNYRAFRYFSRVSMLGKIDMSTVWGDYVRLPEKPGYEVLEQGKLSRNYTIGKYQFLYSFKDSRGISFDVLEINDTTYSMTWIRGRPHFYKYRDPHLFTYFSKK